jgi:hypothetical protein
MFRVPTGNSCEFSKVYGSALVKKKKKQNVCPEKWIFHHYSAFPYTVPWEKQDTGTGVQMFPVLAWFFSVLRFREAVVQTVSL